MSNEDLLVELLRYYFPVSSGSAELILEHGIFCAYDRNSMIFHEGRANDCEYFQLDGITHRFNVNGMEQAVTTGIQNGSQAIIPHFARTHNGVSIFSLQALSSTLFFRLPVTQFNHLRNTHDDIRAFGQRVVEKHFTEHLRFEMRFRIQTAKERLEYFRLVFPALENQISHAVIASFLGITPVSFSRLRQQIARAG